MNNMNHNPKNLPLSASSNNNNKEVEYEDVKVQIYEAQFDAHNNLLENGVEERIVQPLKRPGNAGDYEEFEESKLLQRLEQLQQEMDKELAAVREKYNS